MPVAAIAAFHEITVSVKLSVEFLHMGGGFMGLKRSLFALAVAISAGVLLTANIANAQSRVVAPTITVFQDPG